MNLGKQQHFFTFLLLSLVCTWLLASCSSTDNTLAPSGPSLTLLYPSTGDTIEAGQQEIIIRWESENFSEPVSLTLYNNQDQIVAVIANSIPNSGIFYWTLPPNLPVGTGLYIVVSGWVGLENEYHGRGGEFTLNPSPLRVIKPDSCTTWYQEEEFPWINWTATGSTSGAVVELHRGPSMLHSWQVPANQTSFSDFVLPADVTPGSDYRIVVSLDGGSMVANSDWFTVSPPEQIYESIIWVDIPAGNFTFGQQDDVVLLDYDYRIMKYEVSNAQYAAFLNEMAHGLNGQPVYTVGLYTVDGPYPGDDIIPEGDYIWLKHHDGYINSSSHIIFDGCRFSVAPGYDDFPVTEVTYFGAKAFATHNDLFLPDELEWEKAARGNTGWTYPWGETSPTCELAIHSYCSLVQAVGSTTGSSWFGCYDMAGNVAEWTTSVYSADNPYSRTTRGGDSSSWEYQIRTYSRSSALGNLPGSNIGFRCVDRSWFK